MSPSNKNENHSTDSPSGEFDETFDVVVIGFGFAGGAAAIAAADAGARVLLAEKLSHPGGISITAGGGVRVAEDAEKAFTYLQQTNDHRTPDDVLEVFARRMTELPAYFTELCRINGAEFSVRPRHGNYPYPGYETFGYLEIEDIPGFDPLVEFPHTRGRKGGPSVFKVVYDNVASRAIDVRCDCAAERLITDASGSVTGVQLRHKGRPLRVKSRGGVILACGGFEGAPDMQKQFWQLQPVLSAASPGNTGDGIRMAVSVGADLWHMWHFHGAYGFRHPDPGYEGAIRMKRLPDWTPGDEPTNVEMSWITVDRHGKRFSNEYVPYAQDTGWRDMDLLNTATQSFDRVPACIIVDDVGRRLYPLGQFVYNDRHAVPYDWSDDNLREIENGILKTADTIEKLAVKLDLDPKALNETVERWNRFCDMGQDHDFERPPTSMMPIKEPPFVGGQVWPVVSNTQGGPVHDASQRILNPFGTPIPGLYGAGECGSIWGFLYMAGGNLSECFIGGEIAGREAAARVSAV